jgi:hypothetical protein
MSIDSNDSDDISYVPSTEEVESTEEDFEKTTDTIYFKYEFESLTTVDQIIERLEELKSMFMEYKKHNCELTHPVDTGYCFIEKMPETE